MTTSEGACFRCNYGDQSKSFGNNWGVLYSLIKCAMSCTRLYSVMNLFLLLTRLLGTYSSSEFFKLYGSSWYVIFNVFSNSKRKLQKFLSNSCCKWQLMSRKKEKNFMARKIISVQTQLSYSSSSEIQYLRQILRLTCVRRIISDK